MARLDAAARAKLPDTAFAYVDARGQRRLPIHDEAHVRNALARFGQVAFEDDQAREQARKRLLNAAKKYRIVPVGFISGQLRSERELAAARSNPTPVLPTGFVTLLMTDIEGSTALLHDLGDRYQELLGGVRDLLRTAVERGDGHVVDTRADEFFAAFECARSALETAVGIQRELGTRTWVDGRTVQIRMGIHAGYPNRAHGSYIGMPVHVTARVGAAAHGGQILVSGDVKTALTGSVPPGIRLRGLGEVRLRGIPGDISLFQVTAEGLSSGFPPPRT
jgi:class 3 adenylate cyclase